MSDLDVLNGGGSAGFRARATPLRFDLATGCRLLWLGLAAVLILSGAEKVWDVPGFAATIESHGVVPGYASMNVAYAVALGELLLGGVAVVLLMHGTVRAAPGVVLAAAFTAITAITAITAYTTMLVLSPPPAPVGCGCLSAMSSVTDDFRPITLRNAGVVALLGVSVTVVGLRGE